MCADFPVNSSYGVFSSVLLGPERFSTYTVFTASAHSDFGRSLANSIVRDRSTIVLLVRSSHPFCSGVYELEITS